jgi:RimJ/RimL family protein N-acetyltransferase
MGRLGGYRLSESFGWMQTSGSVPNPPPETGLGESHHVDWISEAEADQLLAVAFPDSLAPAGVPGGWAGARDRHGTLVTTAVVWSAPTVGFIAGVATLPSARGTGYATAACRFLVEVLLARHGAVALIVDAWNRPALQLHQRLGCTWRMVIGGRRTTS